MTRGGQAPQVNGVAARSTSRAVRDCSWASVGLFMATMRLAWQATLSIIERPPGHGSVQVVARPEDRLPAAFQWVYRQLPAPLAAPLTGPVDPNAPR